MKAVIIDLSRLSCINAYIYIYIYIYKLRHLHHYNGDNRSTNNFSFS